MVLAHSRFDRSLLTAFDTALHTPVDQLSVSDVRRHMQMVRSVQAVATARMLQLDRRLRDLAQSPHEPIAVDPHRELRTQAGLRPRDVRALDTQSSAAEAAPALADLLAAGATTPAHLESVGQALRVVGDGRESLLGHVDEIVHHAATMRVDRFDRYVKRLARDAQRDEGVAHFEHQRRSTQLRVWNSNDGMVNLAGSFDPERGAVLLGVLHARVEAMFHSGDRDEPFDIAPGIDANDHRRALALLSICSSGGEMVGVEPTAAVDPRPARAELVVHVDLTTLRDGLHPATVCRTSHGAEVPPATARRLACDADIVPVVLGTPSVPLDVGRSRRLATVHQRRALEAVHDTCVVDGCEVAFARCTVHHIVPWERGGPTDLHNLVPLCSRHHHAVHEGGWRLTLDPATRSVTVTLPGDPVTDAEGPP